jgi:peptide/nickel transport system permease protein
MMPSHLPIRAKIGLYLLAAIFVVAFVGPFFMSFGPTEFVDVPHQPPSLTHLLGTTGQGQDVLSQTVTGARTSLLVGFSVGLLVTLLGATVGAIAASFSNLVDDLLSLMTNVFLVLPSLPMAVVVAAYLPASIGSLVGVLILTGWAWNARVVRAYVVSLRSKEFVLAAIVSGESRLRLVFCEMLPNMITILSSCFVNATIYAIGAEVGLEFLGLGDLSAITWGTNLYWASNDAALLTGAWWTIVPTGLSLALVGTALVLVNSALDDVGNPRARSLEPWRRFLGTHGVSPGQSTPVVTNHG